MKIKGIILGFVILITLLSGCNNALDKNKDYYQKIGTRNFYEDSDYRYSFVYDNEIGKHKIIKEDKKHGIPSAITDIKGYYITEAIGGKIFYYEAHPTEAIVVYNTNDESIARYEFQGISDIRNNNVKSKDEFTYVIDNRPYSCFAGENGFYFVYGISGANDYVIYKLNNNFEITDRVCIMENMSPAAFGDGKIFAVKDNELYACDINNKKTEKLCETKGNNICGYVGDGMLVLSGVNYTILDTTTLKETDIDAEINSEPAYDDKNIYMCTVDKGVLKIFKDTLVPETIYEYNGKQTDSPILSGDTLYFAEISKEQNLAYEIKSVKIK